MIHLALQSIIISQGTVVTLEAAADKLIREKGYEIPQNVVLYRGISSKAIPQGGFRAGDVLKDKGFVYTSTDAKWSKTFADRDRGVLLKMQVPKGSRVAVGNSLEKEVIFPRDTSWRVESVSNGEATLRRIG